MLHVFGIERIGARRRRDGEDQRIEELQAVALGAGLCFQQMPDGGRRGGAAVGDVAQSQTERNKIKLQRAKIVFAYKQIG